MIYELMTDGIIRQVCDIIQIAKNSDVAYALELFGICAEMKRRPEGDKSSDAQTQDNSCGKNCMELGTLPGGQ